MVDAVDGTPALKQISKMWGMGKGHRNFTAVGTLEHTS